ncbi:L,D-transpeptidase [Luteipulveratus sp. YIM 133132]|uniref:L,D-transpeptidase n=1 Tax=Luteipulveratus flavus TaxID=3031728 RepID=A0ABT6CA14_9MICO|nr:MULTISPECIES: L,D-transpeptidase [unclassified Luteipulveratus]MDE9364598.1 L,D-transpeptidase [Luteipulveratus sp. YIM 133132]MDF8265741.1 L,D-transpeptidase [Luteipulveratus sp. YIM 133296]
MTSRPGASGRARLTTVVLGVVVGFALVAGVVVLALRTLGSDDSAGRPVSSASSPAGSAPAATRVPVPQVSADVLAALPRATTDTTVRGAPVDLSGRSHGVVVQVAQETAGFARPGATPVTVVPAKQIGNPTWLPVLAQRDGWMQVRLPSRPNGATAWIPDTGQRTATTRWAVRIDLATGSMTVDEGKRVAGSWRIGQGQDRTPTPSGETFLLAGFVDPQQSFSPVIYALGAHSDTLDTFGGGPGTVAVHGWPTAAGRTGKVSHGCVRIPDAALDILGRLPTGTPVSITA